MAEADRRAAADRRETACLRGRPVLGAAGPLEVIDAMGKLKGKEEVNKFVQKRLKAADRGEWLIK